ncbi:alpha/beta fold hydrolase [Kocuria sp. M1R5S2]|uniref:alpha/beta fold hydrolase n=1 Tax=Kocuria rhizosphaerae TaxID=3376285 RepID=UPI0037BADF65
MDHSAALIDELSGEDTAGNRLRDLVLCLDGTPGQGSQFLDQTGFLRAGYWAPATAGYDIHDRAGVEQWVENAAAHIRAEGIAPLHALVAGDVAYGALLLGARHPELLTSLVISDPLVDENDEQYWDTLRDVHVPTLVIASAPEPDTDITKPQTVAGGVDNGVFVIIDGTSAPAHRTRPASFNEWASSFMTIAEGLRALHPAE